MGPLTPLDSNREKVLHVFEDAAVLQGTIELLVLNRLSQGPMHGYGIASWIETATEDVLRVEEGRERTGKRPTRAVP